MDSHHLLNYGSQPTLGLGSCSMESIHPRYTYLNNSSCAMEDPYYSLGLCETETLFRLYDVRVEIGSLVRQYKDEFLVAWEGPPKGVAFTVDPSSRTCRFCLTQSTALSYSGRRNKRVRTYCDYKVEFLIRDICEYICFENKEMDFVILLRLSSSPCVWCRSRHESWSRTTDFTASGAIGRSNVYKFVIPRRYVAEWNKATDYLRQLRVMKFDVRWPLVIEKEPYFGMPSSSFFYSIGNKFGICFEIIFLVNAVMHKGILNQHQLSDSDGFFDLLRSQSKDVNVAALNYLYSCSRHPVFDACQRLRDLQDWFVANPELFNRPKRLDHLAHVRRLVITPTRAYCIPPEAQLSNRVLRKYKVIGDRFLRVTFMDEGMQTIYSNSMNSYVYNSCPQRTKVSRRVEAILKNGFDFCGRKYSFLAFSSNQLRERSAWFFSECKSTTIRDIQTWMGKFKNRNVAKCSARMGLCFSSTYATVEVPSSKVNPGLQDIKRNGYNFSDGIGKITPDLAMKVAKKLNLDGDPPCAYQIRYAGFKGVIACWPSEGDRFQLSLRRSMNKFNSQHNTLEICSWARLQPGFLNRQIITLLSTLDVPDMVFRRMQQQMLSNLKLMLIDMDAAYDVVTASCGEQGNAAAIMLSAGFTPHSEPHLHGMLTCIRAVQLSGLREKGRIFVPSGRWLMGCLDELGVLEQGQCFIQVSNPSLENCFAKHGSRFSHVEKNLQVIKGLVVVAKNPCLHPGDIRILEAVDAPGLHHLHDCLVFPQKGYRPHSNEASGSDLDGDLYFVTWDENLIPPSMKSEEAMDFDAAEAKNLDRPVTNQDIIEFFVRNMANENLGAICNAHVVHADRSEDGAKDANCIKLAKLAAIAVDMPKTGKIVTMPPHLRPESYPDFMGKEGFNSYMSTKILGELYRQITDAYDEDMATSVKLGCTYDSHLVVPGAHSIIPEALERKRSYDFQLKALMGQYNVLREEEIVTGYIWSMPKSRKRGELQDQLKQAYSALKKEFRECFERIDGYFMSMSDDQKNIMYEQKASAWYMVTYHPKLVEKSLYLQGPDGPGDVPMLSFAWIATDYLARIKIRRSGVEKINSRKPINTLRRYLADRIGTGI
ncbi:hypothetical protein ACLB2K_010205 [Fragaria x ananassa]